MGPYSNYYRQTPVLYGKPQGGGRPQGQGDRPIGFLGPFLLGGLTGGLVAPFFYGNNRPPYYYQPYPQYPPYYYPPYRPY